MAKTIWEDATGVTYDDLQAGRLKEPQPQVTKGKQQAPAASVQPPTVAKESQTDGSGAVERGIATMRGQLAPMKPAPSASTVYAGVGPSAKPSSNYVGDGPTDPDVNGRNAAVAASSGDAVERGIATMKSQLNTAAGGIGAENSVNSAAAESHIKSLYPAGTFDGQPPVASQSSGSGFTVEKGDAAAARIRAANKSILDASPSAAKTQAAANANEADLAGRQGAYMVENNLRQLEDKGNGTVRTVGRGGIAEFTNVGTEAITDPTKKPVVNSYDGAADNASMAKANAIRQQMIDRMPQGGIAILDDGTAGANAEKSQRWQMESLREDIKRAGTRSEKAALAGALNAMISGQNQVAAEGMRAQTAVRGQDVQAGVAMRGQDMQAQNEAARLAGNPIEQQLKQAQAQGIAAQTETVAAIAELKKRAATGDAKALATLQAMSGKGTDYKDRYITLPNRKVYNDMGQIVGEEPGGIFDAATGRAVQPDQPAKAGDAQAKAAQIKADAKAGKISRDEAIKQLQSLGYK